MNADSDEQPVLGIRGLITRFYTDERAVKAVDGSSLDLYEGETLGIVSESGSGKSVTALSIFQLVDNPGRIERGSVRCRGDDLLERSEAEIQPIRDNGIVVIFQDPMTSLDPMFTVGGRISRVIRTHQDVSDAAARERTIELMADVSIPEPTSHVDNYPHQFFGGMRRYALLAMAISYEPDVLIADGPTTALNVTIETQIFNVLDELQKKYGMSIILTTHDLGIAAGACDCITVTYGGRVVERTDVDDLFESLRHPYTRGLMRPALQLTDDTDQLMPIEGDVPNLADLPSDYSFHPRCPHATAECESYGPGLREVEPNREATCLHTRGHDLSPSTIETECAETDGGGPTAPTTDGSTSQ